MTAEPKLRFPKDIPIDLTTNFLRSYICCNLLQGELHGHACTD